MSDKTYLDNAIDDDKYSSQHIDMLMAFPGVNSTNVRFLLDNFTSMQDLIQASKDKIGNVVKSASDGERIWNFLHQRAKKSNVESQQRVKKGSYQKWKESKK